MTSRRTRTLGLPLLKENDAGNYMVVNEIITRMDVMSNLYLESTVVTDEPNYGQGDLYEGQAWAISPNNGTLTGAHWSGVTEDSIAFFGRLPSKSRWTGPTGILRDDLGWYIVPVWKGAYAYDKADGVFKTYTGTTWTQPSKRKITNFTLNKDDIARCSGTGNEDWYTALSVDGPHELLEVHCYVTYSDSQIQLDPGFDYDEFYGLVGGQELPGGQPTLPYILPRVALSSERPKASFDPSSDVVCSGRPASSNTGAPGEWTITGTTSQNDQILSNLTTDPDSYGMAMGMRGVLASFETYPTFNLNANEEGFLLINLSDIEFGDAQIASPSIEDYIHTITFQVTYSGF